MDSSLVAALFGIIGTAVGGVITLLGQWSTDRGAIRRERAARLEARAERRRESVIDYVAKIDAFHENARLVLDVQRPRQSDAVVERARSGYDDAWRVLSVSLGPTQIAGPEAVSDAAGRLEKSAVNFANAIDTYLRSGHWTQVGQDERDDLENTMIAARREFVAIARTSVELVD